MPMIETDPPSPQAMELLAPAGTASSLPDLSLAGRIGRLRDAGVRPVKIAGRMNNSPWVCTVVALVRNAIDNHARLRARRDGSVWQLRPVQPIDLRGLRVPPDPPGEWRLLPGGAARSDFDRRLN